MPGKTRTKSRLNVAPKYRSKQYTARGIKRVPCVRCGGQGYAQWNACAENTPNGRQVFRVLCAECDVGLNELALRYVYGDKVNEEVLSAYREKVLGEQHDIYDEATIRRRNA